MRGPTADVQLGWVAQLLKWPIICIHCFGRTDPQVSWHLYPAPAIYYLHKSSVAVCITQAIYATPTKWSAVDHYHSKSANTRRACFVAVLDEEIACSVAVLSRTSLSVNLSRVLQGQLEVTGLHELRLCIVLRLTAWVEKDDTAILSFSHIVQSQLATPRFLRIYFWHEIQVESIDATANEGFPLFMKSDVFPPWKS